MNRLIPLSRSVSVRGRSQHAAGERDPPGRLLEQVADRTAFERLQQRTTKDYCRLGRPELVMRPHPVGKALRPRVLHVQVVGTPQYSDEDWG